MRVSGASCVDQAAPPLRPCPSICMQGDPPGAYAAAADCGRGRSRAAAQPRGCCRGSLRCGGGGGPQLIPLSFLQKEAEHVEGFAPELALVTKGAPSPFPPHPHFALQAHAPLFHAISQIRGVMRLWSKSARRPPRLDPRLLLGWIGSSLWLDVGVLSLGSVCRCWPRSCPRLWSRLQVGC